jgi:hypothetical protein
MTIQLANHHMRVPPPEGAPFALVLQIYSVFIKEGVYISTWLYPLGLFFYPRVRLMR